MPTPLETAITERDAARAERDAAVTAEGKATAQLEGLTDLDTQHKAERDAVKADLSEKIKEAEKANERRAKLVDEAGESQGKAHVAAKAARIEMDKAKAAQAVETKKAADLQVSVEAHAKAIDGHVGAIGELEEKLRLVGVSAAIDAKNIKELESTVAGQNQELLRLRPARPITP